MFLSDMFEYNLRSGLSKVTLTFLTNSILNFFFSSTNKGILNDFLAACRSYLWTFDFYELFVNFGTIYTNIHVTFLIL